MHCGDSWIGLLTTLETLMAARKPEGQGWKRWERCSGSNKSGLNAFIPD